MPKLPARQRGSDMSLHDCLQRGMDGRDKDGNPLLDHTLGREAQKLYSERLVVHSHLGQAAEAVAASDVLLALRRANLKRRRETALQVASNLRMEQALLDHVEPDGTRNAASALRQLVEWGQSAKHQSVEAIRQALEQSYLRDISSLIKEHSVNILGNVRSKSGLADLVRELKGEATGQPAAKAIADAVRAVLERARTEHNAAGGLINKLEGYDLPHHWDRQKVGKLTADEFVAAFYDTQDWGRIVDHATGQAFDQSSRAAREAFLRDVHSGIKTGGWDSRMPSTVPYGKSMAKSRAAHRVLHFKTADAWLAMNDQFGTADPYSAIITHLQGMARDTAMMRVLGPNPTAGLEYARQVALKQAETEGWKLSKLAGLVSVHGSAADEVKAVGAQAQRMLDMISGAANVPEMTLFASFMSGTRHFLVASQLGGAMLSAVSDVGFMAMAARHVGMNPGKLMASHFATLAKAENRALLIRAGIIGDSLAHTGVVQARLMGEAYGPKVMQRLSEFTLRASGLTAWTDIGRGVFQLEFYGMLAEHAGKTFDELPAPLRELVFQARGITADEWDVIRATDLYRDAAQPEATFLIPDDIRRRTDLDPDFALDLSLKLGSAIREQLEFAVPSTNLRARSSFQGGRPGSASGELLRSTLMFKNFTFSLMFNQLGRVLFHKVNGSRAANIVMFATMTTAAGALSIQLKDLAKGNDPRPMTDWRFWKAAAIQGGGMGIFGDFLYASENRFGGGIASTVAGPVVGLLANTGYLTDAVTTALFAKGPDRAKAMDAAQKEAIRFANQYSGPTNLWYLNAALDRNLWDNLQEWLDPQAKQAFASAAKRQQKNYGNGQFWPRGQPLPSRAPDLFNALNTGATP